MEPLEYLAAKLYGLNPRITVVEDGEVVGQLKLEPARNVRLFYSRRGEKEAVEGILGAAMVLEYDRDTIRIRVFSPEELRRFAYRLLEFADALEIANAVGADPEELAEIYFGGGRRSRRSRRGRRSRDEEEERRSRRGRRGRRVKRAEADEEDDYGEDEVGDEPEFGDYEEDEIA